MSQPLFVRRLTRAERVKIKRLRRKPPGIDVALRAQAVLLSRQGRTVREIGDIVGRNRSTVFRWLQAFDQRGLDALHAGKSPGAPRKADAEYEAALTVALEQIHETWAMPLPAGRLRCWSSTFTARPMS